ncbi:MAG TPA: thioredoxin family protein [Polyangiaceae bacterium]|jgi:tetratricopeptide (TPR) repeat protein
MKRIFCLAAPFLLFASACAESGPPPAAAPATIPPSAATPATEPPPPAATAASAPASNVPAELPFVEDDYARALAEAKSSHRPLFVDGWAPWCHTCLSMRAYTFRDAKVRARAGEFVWVSIDTEKPTNAAWVQAHPMHAWPTLFVVDPSTERTVLEWPNSATSDELVALLDEAKAAIHHEGVLAKADARALEGNTAAAGGKKDEAIAAWKEALADAPAGWPGRAAALESLLDRLFSKKDDKACVETADRELPKVAHGGARAATYALMCASRLPAGPAKRAALDKEIDRARTMAVDESDVMLADDRSCLYEAVVDGLTDDQRGPQAKDVASQWATFLEGEAQKAPDPAARAVFDAHRVEAYLALGAPERALPMLEQSARDFPKDYNPPARQARVYLALKRYDDGLAAIDRALGLVYGPRMLRLYVGKADLLEAKGDKKGAAAALREGVAKLRASPLPPQYEARATELERRASALEGHR